MSYNTYALTRDAIEAALSAAGQLNQEVIVVDNHSPDASGERLREHFASHDAVRVLQNTTNRGFAAANNQGAALAEGEILYFLNADTVASSESTERLYRFLMDRSDAGAVGPRVFNRDGTDQISTGSFFTAGGIFRHYLPFGALLRGADRRNDTIPEATGNVEIVKGCALAIRRDVFDEVGGWDERYFMYSEETELCYGLQAAGYVNYYLREAEIVHYGGASTSQEDYSAQQIIQARSAAQFVERHGGWGIATLNRAAGTLGFAGRAVLFPILAKLRPAKADVYRVRAEAASALWRWFLKDYVARPQKGV